MSFWEMVARGAMGAANTAWGGTKDDKLEYVPMAKGTKHGITYLRDLLRNDPNIPLQGTAGMTPTQMLIQQSLPDIFGRVGESGQLATDEYRRTLSNDYDPLTSPYYEGLRQEADRLKTAGTTQLRQRAQLGGNLNASLAGAQEGEFVNQANSALLTELGRLFETERGRKMLAAEGIQNADARQLSNIAAVGGIAEAERSIEQQQADALYNQALQSILFPYQYQANIANALMNYRQDYMVKPGGPNDFSKFMEGFNAGPSIGGMGGGGSQYGTGFMTSNSPGGQMSPQSTTVVR